MTSPPSVPSTASTTLPPAASPSKDEVDALLTNPSSFGPSLIPLLESYVIAEATTSSSDDGSAAAVPYHLDAHRTLLKLYQFFPSSRNNSNSNSSTAAAADDMTALVLLLSLLEYPKSDFLAVSSLVSSSKTQQQQQHSTCATLFQCADLLDSCQFVEFWTTFATLQQQNDDNDNSNNNNIKNAFDFLLKNTATLRLQKAILQVLATTYRSAPALVIQSALGGDAIIAVTDLFQPSFAPPVQVSSTAGGPANTTNSLITFCPTPDNTKRNRVFKEDVDLTAISKMMILSRE